MKLLFDEKTLIMGILNVTPDSFYDGGSYYDREKAIQRAWQLHKEGADIIDIGGESTRPGSMPISIQEEIDRVCPIVEAITGNMDVPISIDTSKSIVAEEALKQGASIVNDISGLSFDEDMVNVVSRHNPYVIVMHIKGEPETMQNNPEYENIFTEIYSFLEKARNKAIAHGVDREKIIIDPGIGFGKNFEDNYKIIANLKYFKRMGAPLLIGLSRKSLIGKLYNEDSDRLPATIALNSFSAYTGANIIRVHDVEEHRLALMALEMLKKVNNKDGSAI